MEKEIYPNLEKGSEKVDLQKIQERIDYLVEKLKEYNYHYFVKDAPIVTDEEYDLLYKELEKLEEEYPQFKRPDSPTSQVGDLDFEAFRKKLFKPVKHQTPMLSLEKVYTSGEILNFIKKAHNYLKREEKFTYLVEPKYDGLSLALVYQDGKLVYGATRGNGFIGEDVTSNVLKVNYIPFRLKEKGRIEIRGEVVIAKCDFEEFNRKSGGIYMNPRNFVAGTLRQKDSSNIEERKLQFIAYEVIGKEFLWEEEKLVFLQQRGFKIPEKYEIAKSEKELITICEGGLGNIKGNSDFEIDGLVIKFREIKFHQILGNTQKSPRWAFAFKFPSEKALTKILTVDWQLGRTGVFTPVAKYETVLLAGTRCNNASLHNLDYIRQKDIRIGDWVLVEKAGEIIPQIVKVKKEMRTGEEKEILPPSECPYCKSKTQISSDGVYCYCPNLECPQRRLKEIQFFVGKAGLDIKGLGESLIEKLYQIGYIKDIADIFYLEKDKLAELEGLGEKSASNILSSIAEVSKRIELFKLLSSFGIEGVGEVTARKLAQHYPEINSLFKVKEKELVAIEDIGPVIARNIVTYFSDAKNKAVIEKLLRKVNVVNSFYQEEDAKDNFFKDKKVVITGTFTNYKRNELKDILLSLGAKVQSSVSKKTDYLLVGDSPGSKLEKARKLGIEVVDEERLMEIFKEENIINK